MAQIIISHKDGQSIDHVVDYILDNFPDLPDGLSVFEVSTGGGLVAGARGSTSLKITIEYDQKRINADRMREINILLKHLQTLSADRILIEQEK